MLLTLVVALHLAALPPAAPPSTTVELSNPELESADELATVDHHLGLHLSAHAAVAIDVQWDHFWGFVGTNFLVPIASAGRVWLVGLGAGYATRFAPASRWWVAGFVMVSGGNGPGVVTSGYVGVGVGAAFTWAHPSGFTMTFTLPVVGAGIPVVEPAGVSSGRASLALFYFSTLALPLFSIGYRF